MVMVMPWTFSWLNLILRCLIRGTDCALDDCFELPCIQGHLPSLRALKSALAHSFDACLHDRLRF